jgi:superfamily II DNA or RNA helicase
MSLIQEKEIILGPMISLKGFPNYYIEELKYLCTLKNPKYEFWLKRFESSFNKEYFLLNNPEPKEKTILYKESFDNFFVPRGLIYKITNDFPEVEIKNLTITNSLLPDQSFNLKGDYWPGQKEVVEKLQHINFALFVAPTGAGKTNIAIQLVAALNQTTLFLVHSEALMEQAKLRVKKLLDVDACLYGAGKKEVGPFTIGMVQTLTKRNLKDIVKYFGVVILDEAHHAPAETFTELLNQFYASHVYGMSATFNSTLKQAELTIGPLAYTVERSLLEEHNKIIVPEINFINTNWYSKRRYNEGQSNILISDLCKNTSRNAVISDTISKYHFARKSVVLSDRTDQLDILAKDFEHLNPAVFHNKKPKKQVQEAYDSIMEGNALVFSTYGKISEGFDAPDWDQIFFASPPGGMTKTEQSIGRIVRYSPNKETPRVWDFVDGNQNELINRWLNNRKKVYDKINAKVKE